MSINKNKSEIVESFKNLLKKAEEAQGLEEEKQINSSIWHKQVQHYQEQNLILRI